MTGEVTAPHAAGQGSACLSPVPARGPRGWVKSSSLLPSSPAFPAVISQHLQDQWVGIHFTLGNETAQFCGFFQGKGSLGSCFYGVTRETSAMELPSPEAETAGNLSSSIPIKKYLQFHFW